LPILGSTEMLKTDKQKVAIRFKKKKRKKKIQRKGDSWKNKQTTAPPVDRG